MRFRRHQRGATAAVMLALAAAGGFTWRAMRSHDGSRADSSPSYIASDTCNACHAQVHRDYQHVGMSSSFRSIDKSPGLKDQKFDAVLRHAKSGRIYQVIQRDGGLFQRRYELDPEGGQTNVFELEATHTVGSGNHARTYLHRFPTGEFVELPLTWYTQERSWGMSPGYDNAGPNDFSRIVDENCLFCHNGAPQPGGAPAQGIDCQRCHGPGSKHVEIASGSKPDPAKIRESIVNPKRLSGELQLDICMQCHLETTSAELPPMIRRFDRAPFSFRPGEPLGNYTIHFDHPANTGHDDKFEIVNQAYRLRQSACFLKSNARLTCSSCHNPHVASRGADAVAHYRARCVACHPSVPVAGHPEASSANCVNCHMPGRRAEDAVHVVMTDHKIQRNRPKQDLTRPLAEQPATYRGPLAVYYPGTLSSSEKEIYLGVAMISEGADRKRGMAMLESKAESSDLPARALAVLAEGYLIEGDTGRAIPLFERALGKDPALIKARYNLGRALDQMGRSTEARHTFERLIAAQPDFPEAHYALGNALARTGDTASAITRYQEAIRLRPVYSEARNNLGNVYAALGKLDEARNQLEQALRIHPGYAEAYNNLARVAALQNRIPEALSRARRALALKPDYPEARYNLARLLQDTDANAEALAEYRKLLALSPNMPEGHLGLGQLLGNMGRLDAAIAEFREAIRLRPGYPEAQANLETALTLSKGGR